MGNIPKIYFAHIKSIKILKKHIMNQLSHHISISLKTHYHHWIKELKHLVTIDRKAIEEARTPHQYHTDFKYFQLD